MKSRLEAICDAIIEASWLAALVVIPLFFNVYSQRVFEPDKISILRSLALIAISAWVAKKVANWGREQGERSGEERPLWRKPLVPMVLALAAAYLLSTALSVTPRQSFWGSYQRLQGAFTMLSYMAFFLVTLDGLRTREQWQRLQYAIILTSLPIALYGILQRVGLDPLPWGGDTVKRVPGNMGNAIFLAAYLIMAVPLTIERLIAAVRRMLLDEEGNSADALAAGALLFILVLQLVTIILTQSRGPWLGLAAGGYVFLLLVFTELRQLAPEKGPLRVKEIGTGALMGALGLLALGAGLMALLRLPGIVGGLALLLGMMVAAALYLIPLFTRRGWRWLWLSVVTQAAMVAALLVALNVGAGPLAEFKNIPYVGRLAQLTDINQGTGRVRVLIWQGVVDMITPHPPLEFPDGRVDALNPIRPLIGYGPESMWVAYNRFYVPELGGLERRNASPDRSHNETFDSLVITGVFGFLAYILLFASVFYYALKWLGFIRQPRDRLLFGGLLTFFAAAGVLIPILMGVPYFAGVTLALGFILGVLLYITIAALRGSEGAHAMGRRQMLIIALLATVIAHFVEIHFGIAIAATRTYFFIFIAALVALGLKQTQVQPHPEPATPSPPQLTRRKRGRRGRTRSQRAVAPPMHAPLWRRLLPYAFITALIFLVLDWDYISNQTGLNSAFTVFWRAWTTHLVDGRSTAGPGVLWIVLFTFVVAIILAIGETWSARDAAADVARGLAMFAGLVLTVWLVYGLVQAQRLLPMPSSMPVEMRATHVADHIVNFYLWLGILLTLMAATLYLVNERPSAAWGQRAGLAALVGSALLVGALFLIVRVNINLVRADVYFKLGQNTDARRNWSASLLFYDMAARLAPQEDHYQLFRGRALLESARTSADPTQRQTFLDRAEQVLKRARELNPLNTDHSANLARYHAARASTLTDPAAQREELLKASEAYAQATSLSPNAAHLWNEWGSVYQQLGEIEKAREVFQHSLELDPNYFDTYLRIGQLESQQQNWEAALAAYDRAAELRPRDVRAHSARGYVLAQLGRIDEAIAANEQALTLAPNDISTLQNLALLHQQKGEFERALAYARRARELVSEGAQAQGLDALIQQLEQALGEG
ncbi:MAG: tetratricopeptide repeat protein [Chloroflexi bacterium]|nr:tetratricopeptide repeat protein [Chloroflexota bacterium]